MSISSMTLDEKAQAGVPTERAVQVHPLAIVNMADQYTRISLGGSPLPTTEPVVGLLFGVLSPDTTHILDAEDVLVNRSDAASTQISLHQAVFPLNTVVGWYRASSTDESPTPDDLILSQQLQQHYQPQGTGTPNSFLFALLQVTDEETKDGELPFTIFTLDTEKRVLIGCENWKLETAHAERVAVERVMREQPVRSANTVTTKSTETDGGEPITSPFVDAVAPVRQSVAAVEERLAVLEQFLTATAARQIPFNAELVRNVQGLLLHASVMNAGISTTEAAVAAPNHLLQATTTLAKTVAAVQQYTDKVKAVHETLSSGMMSSSGGGGRGRGMFSSFKK